VIDALETADLIKAADRTRQESEGEHAEAFMGPIEAGFAAAGRSIRRDAALDLTRVLGEHFEKASGGLSSITPQQIESLKLLVRQHYLAHLAPDARVAFWAVPQRVKDHWVELGVVGPTGTYNALASIDDAVVAARVAELLEHGTSYRRMVELAQERPQTHLQELARQIAREHAGYAIGRMADRHGDLAATQGLGSFQSDFGAILAQFLAGRLTQGDRQVRGNRDLARALRQRFTIEGGDIERDWLRVAVSETRFAFNYGTFVHYMEQGYEEVYYVVQKDACPHCKRLLLMPDLATPRIFRLDDIIEDLARGGGMNVGRKASLIGKEGGWLPTALIHPWCRCRPVPYFRGLPPIPTGDLRGGERGLR
jgi:hypothetical protein